MQSLDFGSYGDFQFIFRRNRKCSVTITKFPQNMNMRHICPNGFYQLQMRCFYTLENSTMASIRKAFILYPKCLFLYKMLTMKWNLRHSVFCVQAACEWVSEWVSPTVLVIHYLISQLGLLKCSSSTYHQVWARLQSFQDSWDAESLLAPHSSPLEVSRVKAIQLFNIWHLLQKG